MNNKREVIQVNAERIRLVLPLMTRHQIPTSPENYAVWYTYVSGENQELNEHIDQLIESEEHFSDEINQQLFDEHISNCNIEQLEKLRQRLTILTEDTGLSLNNPRTQVGLYTQTLNSFSQECQSADCKEVIQGLLSEVIQETHSIKGTMERMELELKEKSAEIDAVREELEVVRHQASTDPLTGLGNRNTFDRTMEHMSLEATKEKQALCLVMLDIDDFKIINDLHGHVIGDKVIRFIAEILSNSIKGRDQSARYGGEEFAIILPETPLTGGMILTEHIRKQISKTRLTRLANGESLGMVTISAGVAQYRYGEGMSSFISRADKALYRSKRQGKNRVTAADAL
ncbi:MAG: GGDEF domain-containing protein [Gammaproteobacteria bacterium]|nr:GGDEF domain-containing protein [Gammaproteobacteria bacterium]